MKQTCELCFHHCCLEEGQSGYCHARANIDGHIRSLNYGEISSVALDPIEKKPLRMFFPSSKILSIGSYGCNLHCPFCQNAEISTATTGEIKTVFIAPEQLVNKALELIPQGNIGIAYTYNEPLISYEYVMDCARLGHLRGLKNVLVTNGTIEEKPFTELLPYIDALNIDLKAFSDNFYRSLGGNLETTKRSIRLAFEKGCHVEVTTLVIPGKNDSEEEIESLVSWLCAISPTIPYHLSRFFPRFKMNDIDPTPVEIIYRLKEIAEKKLENVFTGNIF